MQGQKDPDGIWRPELRYSLRESAKLIGSLSVTATMARQARLEDKPPAAIKQLTFEDIIRQKVLDKCLSVYTPRDERRSSIFAAMRQVRYRGESMHKAAAVLRPDLESQTPEFSVIAYPDDEKPFDDETVILTRTEILDVARRAIELRLVAKNSANSGAAKLPSRQLIVPDEWPDVSSPLKLGDLREMTHQFLRPPDGIPGDLDGLLAAAKVPPELTGLIMQVLCSKSIPQQKFRTNLLELVLGFPDGRESLYRIYSILSASLPESGDYRLPE